MNKEKLSNTRSSCPLSCALDLLGDRWSLLLLRDILFYGKHEFHEFLASTEGISTNILANRLKRLMAAEILRFRRHPQDRKRKLYYLTAAGKELIHPLMALTGWARHHIPDTYLPAEAAEEILAHPEGMIKKALNAQLRWEKEHLS